MIAFWHWLVVNDLYHDIVADLTIGVFGLTLYPLVRRVNKRLKEIIIITTTSSSIASIASTSSIM